MKSGLGLPTRHRRPHSIVESRVPVPSSLRREVKKVVDGAEEIQTAFPDVLRKPRMPRIEVTHRAVFIPRKDRHRGVLPPLPILAEQVVLERVRPATQEAQVVPASRSGVAPE